MKGNLEVNEKVCFNILPDIVKCRVKKAFLSVLMFKTRRRVMISRTNKTLSSHEVPVIQNTDECRENLLFVSTSFRLFMCLR